MSWLVLRCKDTADNPPAAPDGARGAGRKLADARRDRADVESEVEDLLDIIAAIEENEGVATGRVAIVGE